MRRRAVRDLGLIVAVGVILTSLVFANTELRQGGLVEQMENLRSTVEASRQEQGLELLSWDVIRRTRGTRQTAPTFADELKQRDNTRVDLIGFMVPLHEFREVTEFLLLPLPLICYFCEAPPMREVILVRMREDETANLVNEPVMINGHLMLHQSENAHFFYTIDDALWGPGREDQDLTRTEVPMEHRLHQPVQEMQEQLREHSERQQRED